VVGDAAKYREALLTRYWLTRPAPGWGSFGGIRTGDGPRREDRSRTKNGPEDILTNCATLLKPGGALVYATCTTEPEENEDLINAFIAAGRGEFRIDDPRPYLPPPAGPLIGPRDISGPFPMSRPWTGSSALDWYGMDRTRKSNSTQNGKISVH